MHRAVIKIGLIAVIAVVLFGLGSVIVMRAREQANRARCMDNLRQVGWFALWHYTEPDAAFPKSPDARPPAALPLDVNRLFPPGTIANPDLAPDHRLAWTVLLLPYLGKEDVHKKFDLTQSWDSEANQSAIATLVSVFECPTQFQRPAAGSPYLTHYIGVAGLGPDAPTLKQTDPRAGFLRYDDATKVGSVQRGLSRTMTILETATDHGPWAAGGPATVRGLDPARPPYIGAGGQFGGHAQGATAAFADGSVRFQANSISPRVLEMLTTLRPMPDEE